MFSHRTNWKLTPNRLTQVLNEVRASGAPILDLTISNPTQCGFRYDTNAILAAFQNPQSLSYVFTQRLQLLVMQACDKHEF